MASESKYRKIPYHLIVVYLLLSAGIWLAGYLYYQNQKEYIKKEKQEDLTAIAELKMGQIVTWRKERLGDAALIYENHLIISHIQKFLERPEVSAARQEIFSWMKSLNKNNFYKNVILLDREGNIKLAVSNGEEVLGPDAKRLAAEALRANKVILSDLYKGKIANVIRLTLVVPLHVSHNHTTLPVAVLLLRIDPNQFLYSLIQSWPTHSETAETILLRREGEKVVFLNELRHRKNTALTLGFPFSEEKLPAAMAVRGIKGVVEGVDYRGVPVLASIQAIPDSPWFLVAKVDREEIYAPVRERFWIITIVVTLLILGSGFFIGLLWRHQRVAFYREQYSTELRNRMLAERYEHLTRYANDIILLLDKSGRIIDANERAIVSYGYSRDELLRLSLNDIRSPEARSVLVSQLQHIEERNGMVFEIAHQRKDGTVFPVEVSSRVIEVEGEKLYQNIIRDISERKKVEDALRESEERLRTVIEASLDAIVVVNDQGRIVLFNSAAEELFLYSSAEVLDKPASILLRDNVADPHQRRVEKFLGDGVGQCGHIGRRVEQIFRRKDGTTFEAEVAMAGGRSDHMRLVVFSVHDITERKRAEAQLLEEKNFSDSTINSLPGVFYFFNQDGRFLKWNRNMESITGYSPEEILQMNPLDLVAGEDKEIVGNAIQEVLLKGKSFVEANLLSKDGNKTPYLFTGQRFISGDQSYIVGMGIDITERKHAEQEVYKLNEELAQRVLQRTEQIEVVNRDLENEIIERRQIDKALRESEIRYRTLFEQSPDGVLLLDPETILPIDFNEAAHTQLGYSREEFARLKISDYEVIKKPEDIEVRIDKILHEGRDDFETKHRTKQGEIRDILVTVQRMDLFSKPVFHCNYRDITDLKRIEEKIKQLNEDLQRRAVELEALNNELESFSYSVSHDLRAPLRAIDGFSQALLDEHADKLDEDGKNFLWRVRGASQRMAQLIDDLLNLSRVTRSEIRHEVVNLSALAKIIAEELQAAQPGRNVEFIVREGLFAKGDARLFRILLDNLLGNAFKFTGKLQSPRIEFGITNRNGEPVYFVQDNGAGFDMTYANKLFGAFQRLHSQTDFPGTGIGLAIVQRIVHRHGGRVWAEGEGGKGATFYFTLKTD
jgi:PAS domain S-box-containing protein